MLLRVLTVGDSKKERVEVWPKSYIGERFVKPPMTEKKKNGVKTKDEVC